jgi:pimeloyl-ACP methyl ester carboxylesterase
MSAVAAGLADAYRVLEPFQRRSGGAPLTVARHVEDLHGVVSGCRPDRPVLVGHSWGAMLALAYGAAHPGCTAGIVLVGCGTFDRASRERMRATVEGRLREDQRARLAAVPAQLPDPDRQLAAIGDLLLPVYSHDVSATSLGVERCDGHGHDEAWGDMVRLQDAGIYPAAFAAIRVPVLMLHGSVDPHPGAAVRASLAPYLPQLEYREWPLCGHYPWLETGIRAAFFAVLRAWLHERFETPLPGAMRGST